MKNKTKKRKGASAVIEFSPARIKIVQATVNSKTIFTHLVSLECRQDSERGIIEAAAGAIKAHRLCLDRCVVCLDRSYVSSRIIKLPTVNQDEIKDMVRWQAAKLLPHFIDEIVVSHRTITVSDDGFSYVLVVVVPQSSVEKYARICDGLRLKPSLFTISSEGLQEWYRSQQSSFGADDVCALFDIEEGRCEAVVLFQGKFVFSRSFSLPAGMQTAQVKQKIIEEVRASLESYGKQEIYRPIKSTVLIGDENKIKDFVSFFTYNFSLTPRCIHHFANLDIKKASTIVSSEGTVSFASACGCLLGENALSFNLMPAQSQFRLLYAEKKQQLKKTLILAVCAAVFFLGAVSSSFHRKKQFIDSLDAQINSINPAAREIETIKNKMAIISDQLDSRGSCLEILRELYAVTPEEISLAAFIFDDEKSVVIKGNAAKMSSVFNFVPVLSRSDFFDNVEVRYATQRRTARGETTDFELVCQLNARPGGQ